MINQAEDIASGEIFDTGMPVRVAGTYVCSPYDHESAGE